MKLASRQEGDRIIVFIRGEVEGSSCDCLDHFWDHYLDPTPTFLTIDMNECTEIDALGVATMINRLRASKATGAEITLISPPQFLAHTLYKIAELGSLNFVARPTEEPYGG